MHMVRRYHGGKENRPLQYDRSFSCVRMLSMHEPVKSNLPTANKRMHMVRSYGKWKREQTTLISWIIFVCWNDNNA